MREISRENQKPKHSTSRRRVLHKLKRTSGSQGLTDEWVQRIWISYWIFDCRTRQRKPWTRLFLLPHKMRWAGTNTRLQKCINTWRWCYFNKLSAKAHNKSQSISLRAKSWDFLLRSNTRQGLADMELGCRKVQSQGRICLHSFRERLSKNPAILAFFGKGYRPNSF